MTIVIPSHQRRERLSRLLRALDYQVAGSQELRLLIDVVVVVRWECRRRADGSKRRSRLPIGAFRYVSKADAG
jgi:hypothetical protein